MVCIILGKKEIHIFCPHFYCQYKQEKEFHQWGGFLNACNFYVVQGGVVLLEKLQFTLTKETNFGVPYMAMFKDPPMNVPTITLKDWAYFFQL